METFDLNSISVKSPCTVSWETMTGDERTRFCKLCKLNVFNLSEMTRFAAEELIRSKEGRLCVRYIKRADGTIQTRDCSPVRAVRLRRRLTVAIASGLLIALQVVAWVNDRTRRKNSPLTRRQDDAVVIHQVKNSRLYSKNAATQKTVDWIEKTIRPDGRNPFVLSTMQLGNVDTSGM